ncbi:hypothetical protein GCM10010174_30260 [Kutzneria viridogrisea]|nr:hypothetical protein [Kutzneria albida]MBA8928986.1 hypothetical protein [Kutzneria viridogrisea]
MSKIHTNPGHMRKSGNKLTDFGGKLAAGGEKLNSAGQNLVAHASRDSSGFGAVITKAFGKGLQITGKVFGEGGRVVETAGKHLGTTADLHEEADHNGASLLNKHQPHDKTVKLGAKGGTHTASAKSGGGGKGRTVDKLPGGGGDHHESGSTAPSGAKNHKVDKLPGGGGERTRMSGDLREGRSAAEELPDILKRHGVSQAEFDSMRHRMNQPGGTANVSHEEAMKFRRIREDIPLERNTPVQKVLNPQAAHDYLSNTRNEHFDANRARGCFARMSDARQMSTPAEFHDGLRLDFKGTPFSKDMESVHVLRSEVGDPKDYPIPFGGPNQKGADNIGGKNVWGEPFTGNGYTGSNDHLVPEWDRQDSPLRNGDTIHEIDKHGNERLVARYSKRHGWVRV